MPPRREVLILAGNQMLPSAPTASLPIPEKDVGKPVAISVMAPAVVMRPIFIAEDSANQSAPSGPTTMLVTPAAGVGTGNSAISPAVVNRPILFSAGSVNQRAPSGPAVIAPRRLKPATTGWEGKGNSVSDPEVVIRPIRGYGPSSGNQSALSEPVARPGWLSKMSTCGSGNSAMVPPVVMRPMLCALASMNQRAPSGPLAMA